MFMPLSSKTGKYPVACEKLLSPDEPERGAYFPDDVMDGLLAATHGRNVPAFARTELSTGRAIPPEESKKLIIKALGNFYPPLGEKAGAFFAAGFDASVEHPHIEKQITQSSSRWQIAFVPRGKTRTQNTVPADSPANPNPRSVIQYDYDNSINSTVYIGHELGHGIADELIRGKDNKKFGDNPLNLDELQAYVSQSIVYDYLRPKPPRDTSRPHWPSISIIYAAKRAIRIYVAPALSSGAASSNISRNCQRRSAANFWIPSSARMAPRISSTSWAAWALRIKQVCKPWLKKSWLS
jgi:hypothetical protein